MRWLCLLIGVVLWSSCEKSISFDLETAADVLVVDASIENGKPPVVVLTNSVGYFDKISPQILANLFVHDAQVEIGDGTTTHRLKEYAIDTNALFKIYYYTIDSNAAARLVGQTNTGYTLRIVHKGQTYEAKTTIPAFRHKVDSLWWKPLNNDDTANVLVMAKLKDPEGFGDYLRYFTRTNNSAFLPPPSSVFDDLFVNGNSYEVPVEPGVDRNLGNSFEERFFTRGDTVTFKISNIDKATYDFWRTMEYSYASVGNPFSTPVKVLGNISNGALGYFGGYAAQYHTLVVPK